MRSRPSDVIAMAVRFGQPIFVNRVLLISEKAVDLRGARETSLAVDGITVQALADAFQVPARRGVVIVAIDAPHSGLRRGDLVVELDDQAVETPVDFPAAPDAAHGRAMLIVLRDGPRLAVALESRGLRSVD